MKRKLSNFINSICIFLLGQILFTALSYSSLVSFKNNAALQIQLLNASQLAQKISLNYEFGRDIHNIPSLNTDLLHLINSTNSSQGIIIDSSGRVVTASNDIYTNINIFNEKNSSIQLNDTLFALAPANLNNKTIGYVLLDIKKEGEYEEDSFNSNFIKNNTIIIAISFIAFICLYLCLKKIYIKSINNKKLIFIIPFIICLTLNAILIIYSNKNIINSYTDHMEYYSAVSVNNDLKRVSALGINFEDISGIDNYFISIQSRSQAVGSIALTDANTKLLVGDSTAFLGTRLAVLTQGKITGFSYLKASNEFIRNIYFKLSIDFLCLIIISSIFAFEIKSLLHFQKLYKNDIQENGKAFFDPLIIRPLGFILIFGMFLTLTLVPLKIANIPNSLNIDQNILMSLPVSTEMGAIALASFILLFFQDKFVSWKKVLPLGIATVSIAALISGLASSIYLYLSGRFLYGFGYGFVLLGCQLFILSNTKDINRGESFSSLSAGGFSGILCGCAAGGMIAERLNITSTFIFSSSITACVFLFVLYLIKTRSDAIKADSKKVAIKLSAIISFIKNKEVASFLIFQVIPYSALSIGIFNFFLPVLFAKEGFSLSVAGQINILYSLCIISLAPIFGKLLDRARAKYKYLAIGLCFSALAPLFLSLNIPLLAAILAVLALGISASINESGQIAYIVSLKSAQNFGSNASVILLDAILRIGQIIGPTLIALAITIAQGFAMYIASFVAIVCTSIFLFISSKVK